MGPNDTDGEVPEWAQGFAARLSRDGLLAPDGRSRELRHALNDLNHRLRYALGEHNEPPGPSSVP
jgi:hypothetical protein